MTSFQELPDVIVLNIFSYMSVKDLCKISRVCKSWRRIACDKTLWKHIDMTTCAYLDLRKVWKFYRTRLSDVLRSLKMVGYYSSKCGNEKQKKQLLSDALLEEISSSCPFIEELHLYRFFLEKMSVKKLPATLTHLKLRECAWPLGWLRDAELQDLYSLDLGKTCRIGDMEMGDVTKFSNLEELNLEELYRIGDNGVKILAENLPNLKVLKLTQTKVSDLGVHHICRHMVSLTSLDLGYTQIKDSAIDTLSQSLFKLNILGTAGTHVTDLGVRTLCFSKIAENIKQLDISATNITDSALNDISDKMINLEYLDVAICKLSRENVDDMYNHLPKLINVNMGRGK
ncbi:hypothetical protein ACF0H5_004381 [Mactra antiquata]